MLSVLTLLVFLADMTQFACLWENVTNSETVYKLGKIWALNSVKFDLNYKLSRYGALIMGANLDGHINRLNNAIAFTVTTCNLLPSTFVVCQIHQ